MHDGIDIKVNRESVEDTDKVVCLLSPGTQTGDNINTLWFENLTECRDYIDNKLHLEDAESESVKFKNKVRELRNILKSIQQNKSCNDDTVEFIRAGISSVINDTCAAGRACTPISITDILTDIAIKNSKLSQEKQKNIYAIPPVVWRQVFTELYNQGYISITTVLVSNEQVVCIVPLKPYNWLA